MRSWLLFSVAVMDACDESSFVRVAEVHRWNGDGTFSRRCALSAFENEPGAVSDGDRFDSAADGILNWFECDPEVIAKAGRAFESVNVYIKRNELWFEQSAERRCQNFERQSTGLTRADVEQCVALLPRRPLIDKQTDGAVSFVDRSRPRRSETETEAIERQIVIFAAIDSPDADAMAKPGGWRRGELARTTVIAIARLKIIGVEKPFRHLLILLFCSAQSLVKFYSRSINRSNPRYRITFHSIWPSIFGPPVLKNRMTRNAAIIRKMMFNTVV